MNTLTDEQKRVKIAEVAATTIQDSIFADVDAKEFRNAALNLKTK